MAANLRISAEFKGPKMTMTRLIAWQSATLVRTSASRKKMISDPAVLSAGVCKPTKQE
ncbi:MAG: hypothetical protein QME21_04140 [Anaerolineales bacterium]|nr:hypothetical protein [Anaerolineales bacterium]